jgi:WD40 repeat protein
MYIHDIIYSHPYIYNIYVHDMYTYIMYVHNTGKVMISCGRDNTVRLWDMTSTKELYARLQKPRGYGGFQHLRWRPRGEGFCYALGNDVSVCDTESEEPVVRFSHPRPPFTFAYVSEHTVATGGEDKIVRVWDVRTGKVAQELPQFTSRIRALVAEPLSKSLRSASVSRSLLVYNRSL